MARELSYATYMDGGEGARRRCWGLGRFEPEVDEPALELSDGVLDMVPFAKRSSLTKTR